MDYVVYVLSKDGKPLMPISRRGKVRHLLRDKAAKIVNYRPFTIQLTHDVHIVTEDVTLDVKRIDDNHVKWTASTKDTILCESIVESKARPKKPKKPYRKQVKKHRYRKPLSLKRKGVSNAGN